MRWIAGVAFALVVAACGGSTCPSSTIPDARQNPPFLWRVTGEHGSIVLFGTYHAAGAPDVPESAWQLLRESDLFVAEAAEVEVGDRLASGRSWDELFELPRGESLEGMLSRDDYFTLTNLLEMRRGELAHFKPWVAMLLLTKRKFRFPEPNISTALVERARELGIEEAYLDTWEQQTEYLDEAVGAAELSHAIRDRNNIGCRLTRSVAAYRAGDDAPLRSPIDANHPLARRVERWLPAIEEYLASGRRAFVAVGVANVLGPRALIAQLERRGYRVARIGPAVAGTAR